LGGKKKKNGATSGGLPKFCGERKGLDLVYQKGSKRHRNMANEREIIGTNRGKPRLTEHGGSGRNARLTGGRRKLGDESPGEWEDAATTGGKNDTESFPEGLT